MADRGKRRRSSKGRARSGSQRRTPVTTPQSGARRARRTTPQQARRRQLLTTIGGAVAIALVAALVLIALNVFGGDDGDDASDEAVIIPTASASPSASPTASPASASPTGTSSGAAPGAAGATGTPASTGRTMGDPNAPVTIVEWADYQCPFCGLFAREYEPRMVAEYVDSGKVYFEFRDFPFLGDESFDAAEAAACALDQGRFWEMHHAIFANQSGENEGAFARDRLVEIARGVGLDLTAFETCIDDDRHLEDVQASRDEARAQGINSTPTLFVNGQKYEGIRDYEELRGYIEQALAGQ